MKETAHRLALQAKQALREEIAEHPEKSGGIYYAYPVKELQKNTPPPPGYRPFYISHFGRHGARYLAKDENYKWIIDLFQDALKHKALTPLGKNVLDRLMVVWAEVEGQGGNLTPSGERENQGIAERMFRSYPEVFADHAAIHARSTQFPRVILSMDAFCERLKELNPTLRTSRKAGAKYERYLNHHKDEAVKFRLSEEFNKMYGEFVSSHVSTARFVSSLFSDHRYIEKKVKLFTLMWEFFYIAVEMQNLETDLSFFDVFNQEELFNLWVCNQYKFYVHDANASLTGGMMMENGKPLLRNMIDGANQAIRANRKGASLRFAHEGNFVPLTLSLHLQDCYNSESDPEFFCTAWPDFRITPMSANVQMIFYRNESGDILVKILLNEQEVAIQPLVCPTFPYYRWEEANAFYESYINS